RDVVCFASAVAALQPSLAFIYALSLHDALPIFLFCSNSISLFLIAFCICLSLLIRQSKHIPLRPVSCLQIVHLKTFLFLYIYFRSAEHTSELQSRENLVCRLLLETKQTPAYNLQ